MCVAGGFRAVSIEELVLAGDEQWGINPAGGATVGGSLRARQGTRMGQGNENIPKAGAWAAQARQKRWREHMCYGGSSRGKEVEGWDSLDFKGFCLLVRGQ